MRTIFRTRTYFGVQALLRKQVPLPISLSSTMQSSCALWISFWKTLTYLPIYHCSWTISFCFKAVAPRMLRGNVLQMPVAKKLSSVYSRSCADGHSWPGSRGPRFFRTYQPRSNWLCFSLLLTNAMNLSSIPIHSSDRAS